MQGTNSRSRPAVVTLASLARELGVHVSTVSRALSDDSSGVGADTADRIRRLAAARGYRRNATAQALRTGQSRMIGVMVPRLTDLVQATVYDGIDEAAIAAGYNTVVVNTRDRPEIQESRLDLMLSRQVDGMVITDSRTDANLLPQLRRCGVPYILAMRRMPGQVSVSTDDLAGGRLAAEHLLSLGHERVGVVGGDPHASTGADRTQGFRSAYADAGFPVADDLVASPGFEVHGGHAAGSYLLDLPSPPTAIFAASDFAAVGVLAAMRDRGLSAPRDVAVVGFNDLDIAAEMPVPLTSVRSPLFEMGAKSIEMLLRRMRGERVRSRVLRPRLQIRASTVARG